MINLLRKKENKFEQVVRVCLAEKLFESLHNQNKNSIINHSPIPLLYCTKDLTKIIILQFIKNCPIDFNLGINWSLEKRILVKNIYHVNNNNEINYYEYFPNLNNLRFFWNSNENILKIFPKSLKELSFGDTYNHPICGINASTLLALNSLEKLTFGKYYNQSSDWLCDANNLIELTFGYFYNTSFMKPLPISLKSLSFGSSFNQQLIYENNNPLLLNNTLTELRFGYDFDQSLINVNGDYLLPDSLKKLHLGERFNYPLNDNYLPKSLTELSFGQYYNKSMFNDYILPLSLESLIFGNSFNQPMINFSGLSTLPIKGSLKYISFGTDFNNKLENAQGALLFPGSLTSVVFGNYFNQKIENIQGALLLPGSLTSVVFGNNFNQKIENTQGESLLPESLRSIIFGNSFNQNLCNHMGYSLFYKSLRNVRFGNNFNQKIDDANGNNILPCSMTELKLGNKFNQKITNALGYPILSNMTSLVKLTFGDNFNKPFVGGIKLVSLTELKFGNSFNQPLFETQSQSQSIGDDFEMTFPVSLEILKFGNEFNQHILKTSNFSILSNLTSLIKLTFGIKFNKPFIGDY